MTTRPRASLYTELLRAGVDEWKNRSPVGRSGLVGGFCLRAMVADKSYSRIVLLNRRELAVSADPRLSQRTVNFDNLSDADFAGAQVVFCSLGTTIRKAGTQDAFRRVDLEYPLMAAKASRQAGGQQFVLVSSVGADPSAKNFYLRTKGELEQGICSEGFNAVHIFRPSLLLGKREEFRLGERVAMSAMPLLHFAMLGGLRRYRAISAESVGKAMVVAARQEKSGTFIYEYEQIIAFAA